MRLAGSRSYYRPSPPKMPPGLVELMEGLTREVLKQNPTDIYGLCASHMAQLLEKRDGPSLKKSLTLEQKIARAQERVKQMAEARRQEYNENTIVIKENKNESEAHGKDGVNSIPQPVDVHINEVISVPNKDSMSYLHDEVAQNITKSPVRQGQALECLAEMEFSQAGMGVTEPKIDINEDKIDQRGDVELDKKNNQENCGNVIKQSSNAPVHTIIEKDSSVNTKPLRISTEIVDTKPNEDIISDTSKSPIATDLNDNQQIRMNDEGQVEIVEGFNKITEVTTGSVGQPKAVTDAEYEIANTTYEIKDDKPKANRNEQIVVETDNTKKVHEFGYVYERDSVNQAHTNVEQIQHTEQVLPLETFEVMNQLNVATEFQTPGDIMKSNNIADSQSKNDSTLSVLEVSIDDMNSLQNNGTEIPLETENDTQGKYDDDFLFNNAENDSGKKGNTSVTETDVYIDSLAAGADSDIPTLVTEDSSNDTHDNKMLSKDVIEPSNSHQNKSEVDTENTGKLNSDASIPGHIKDDYENIDGKNNSTHQPTTDNDDTTQGKILPSVSESNATENQGNDNMNLETAAITIQKVFRNFLFKNRGSTFGDTSNDDGNFLDEDGKNKEEYDFSISNSLSTDRRAHGLTRMDTVLQTVNEEKSLSLSTDDSSTLSSAATIIQAHVRGYLVRNRLNSNKTLSTNSIANSNSNEPSQTSIDANHGNDQIKNKTVLNIHIVPEGDNYLSRDESLITSMDLSLDSSPPSSSNLHPLGYDKSERRKQLKREDAIQSVSPPSNNSGKLSEDFDSVKESLNDHDTAERHLLGEINTARENLDKENGKDNNVENGSLEIISNKVEIKDVDIENYADNSQTFLELKRESLGGISSDETDVVTPITLNEDSSSSNLIHPGEFHDVVLPTRVSRSDTSVVSDFKNVLVYFLLWNDSY